MKYNTLEGETLINFCVKNLEEDYEVYLQSNVRPYTHSGNEEYFTLNLYLGQLIREYYRQGYRRKILGREEYNLEQYFLDINTPSEQELIMFEFDTGLNKFIILLLLSLATVRDLRYPSVYLERKCSI